MKYIAKTKLLLAVITICPALLLSGCFYNDEPPDAMASGKEMYQEYCAGCHKPNGVGKFFLGIPASISAELSRADTVRLIREGDPRFPRMPVFPQIKFSQAHKIYNHLQDLRERHLLNQ